jgi:hypothetical protein
MRLATTLTRAQLGLKAPEVVVEAHVGGGLPQFTIIGLIETAVRESRDRVRAAISQSGQFPDGRISSTSRRPICPRAAAASIWPRRLRFWRPPVRYARSVSPVSSFMANWRFPAHCGGYPVSCRR